MLDILFVLLLFFMVTAGAQIKETMLNTDLPGQSASPPLTKIPIRIDINDSGEVVYNNQKLDPPTSVDLPNMTGKLTAIIKASPDQPVILTPAPTARHQRVIDVLNACASAHVKNLAFGSAE